MIRVVLHEPQELVNIAHVVRAMMNFALTDLVLVHPAAWDTWRIAGIAHRSEAFLDTVRVVESLDQALADCVYVAGFSARGRTAKTATLRPREAASEALAQAARGPVALLFGREDQGLDNASLDRCHRVVTIPSDAAYPSLNLGHAVVVMAYELSVARGAEAQPLKAPRRRAPAATRALLEQLFADVEATLEAIDFFKTRQKALIMRTVRSLVQRVPLDLREAKLLRAMAIEVRKHQARQR